MYWKKAELDLFKAEVSGPDTSSVHRYNINWLNEGSE